MKILRLVVLLLPDSEYAMINTNRKFRFILILGITFVFSFAALSGTKTFVREYKYPHGEDDSKSRCRSIAMYQVKKMLLEEVGVYLQSTFQMERKEQTGSPYAERTSEQIMSITAGITETKIDTEYFDDAKYWLKAEITIDPEEVNKRLKEISGDEEKTRQLEDSKQRADSAYAEIERLKQELLTTKSELEKTKLQKKYDRNIDALTAEDWYQKGENAYNMKDYEHAILYYQKAIDLKPDYPTAYNDMGLAYYSKGTYDKAISLFLKAVDLEPDFAEAYHNMADVYRIKGDYNKAIKLFQKAIKRRPNFPGAYNNMGFAYYQKGDYDEAIKLYQKAIELKPDFVTAYHNMAFLYECKHDYDKAFEIYQKITNIDPSFDTYSFILNDYKMKGDFDKAIEVCQKRINVEPKKSSIYSDMGGIYKMKGSYGKAIELYQKAIRLDSSNTDGYWGIGEVTELKGDSGGAIEWFDKVIKYHPTSLTFYILARQYTIRGYYDKAIEVYQKLIDFKPGDRIVYSAIADAYDHKGNHRKAIQCYQKAARLGNPDAQKYLKEKGLTW